ncbi:hypothetical protein ACT028_24700, partial [Pseudomonas aeruginosa]
PVRMSVEQVSGSAWAECPNGVESALPAETVEREFRDAGFVVQKHLDFIPLYHMWRVYILRKE